MERRAHARGATTDGTQTDSGSNAHFGGLTGKMTPKNFKNIPWIK
jgi:hypothetical protein